MKNVVIVDAVRTAIGKLGGSIGNETVDFLGSHVIEELIRRTDLDKSAVEEVILGQAKQSADASNLARVAMLRAGIPVEVPAIRFTDNVVQVCKQSTLLRNKFKPG